MNIQISKMVERDIEKVVTFHNIYLGKTPFINKEEFQKRLNTNTGIFLIAKKENKIVGIKLAYIDKDVCIGRGIAVDKRYRRVGIGTNLIKRFEKELKKFKSIKKYIFASSSQEGIPFHIKMGYTPSILIQYKEKSLIKGLNLKDYIIEKNIYKEEYDIYQLYLKTKKDIDIKDFLELKSIYPLLDIQYLFTKKL